MNSAVASTDWLDIYADLLRRPIGWVATAIFYVLNVPIYYVFIEAYGDSGYFEYTAFSQLIGLVMFAGFIFPMLRIMLRDSVDMERPRWKVWLAISVLTSILLFILAYSAVIALLVLAPDIALSLATDWLEFFFYALFGPIFIGVFVWETALICGKSEFKLWQVHRFVWSKRAYAIFLYFAISVADFAINYGIDLIVADWTSFKYQAAISFPYAIVTWALSLLAVALFLDLLRAEQPIEKVFE